MNIDDFYRSEYQHEVDRRHQISGQIGMPIAVVTVVSGAVYAMARGINIPLSLWEWLTLLALGLAFAAALAFAYYVCKFQFGYFYHYLPTLAKLADYRSGLEGYHTSVASAQGEAETEYQTYIQKELVECAHHNALKNDVKAGFLYRAHTALAAYVGLTFLASIPSLIDGIVNAPQESGKPSHFEVITMVDAPEFQPPPPPPPERIERPEPPERRIIRENEIPREDRTMRD